MQGSHVTGSIKAASSEESEDRTVEKKTRIRSSVLLAATAIVVGACGTSGASTAPSGAASTAPSADASVAPTEATYPTGDFAIRLWTKEGETDGSLQYVQKLADDYTAMHPNVTFTVVNKDVELLREDFQTASLAGDAPELLWTVADHVGPFTAADLILPLNDLVDSATFVPAAASIVTVDGTLWGAPTSFGNQLMLYWNKDLAGDTAPADSAAWIAAAKDADHGRQLRPRVQPDRVLLAGPVPGRLRRQRLRRGRRHAHPGHRRHDGRPAVHVRPQVHRQGHARPRPTTTSPTACSRTATRP